MSDNLLDKLTVRDIDAPVTKILRGLGNPEPPLRLELVRELLSLDRQYYTSSDEGILAETLHRIRIGAKQAMARPGLLLDVIRQRKLSALWIPDRRRILIDSALPPIKHRWAEAHEIGHSLIPWHSEMAHGDNRVTLSVDCEQQIEAEANFAAARLLFMQEAFAHRLFSSPVNFANVRQLSKVFGNTLTSTLWRTVESLPGPAFGLVSQHPRADMVSSDEPLVHHYLRSPAFRDLYPAVTPDALYIALRRFCWGKRGPIGTDEILLRDRFGGGGVFLTECFWNGYQALTLGLFQRAQT